MTKVAVTEKVFYMDTGTVINADCQAYGSWEEAVHKAQDWASQVNPYYWVPCHDGWESPCDRLVKRWRNADSTQYRYIVVCNNW